MLSLLLLGFLIGMRHAFEADHVAAVASLVSGEASLRRGMREGAAWGLGHTLTLFLFGSIVLWMDTMVPERLASGLEFAVGAMLVLLGADVLRRLVRDRVHFHLHRHADGAVHFHAHSHAHGAAHEGHAHPRALPVRALLVGMMHGMAGSAALILLTLQTLHSPWLGMLYIALFGIGSIFGMAALSAVIVIPLRYSASGMTWLHNGLQLAIGLITLGVGSAVLAQGL